MSTMQPFTLQMTHSREILWYERGVKNLVVRNYYVMAARTLNREMRVFVTRARDPRDVLNIEEYEALLWLPLASKEDAKLFRRSVGSGNTVPDYFDHALPIQLDRNSLGLGIRISVLFPTLGNLSLSVEEIFDNISDVLRLPSASSLLSEYLRLRRRFTGVQERTEVNPRGVLRLVR